MGGVVRRPWQLSMEIQSFVSGSSNRPTRPVSRCDRSAGGHRSFLPRQSLLEVQKQVVRTGKRGRYSDESARFWQRRIPRPDRWPNSSRSTRRCPDSNPGGDEFVVHSLNRPTAAARDSSWQFAYLFSPQSFSQIPKDGPAEHGKQNLASLVFNRKVYNQRRHYVFGQERQFGFARMVAQRDFLKGCHERSLGVIEITSAKWPNHAGSTGAFTF